ncbi:MAG TPA: hypothetical protein VGP93_09335, partial [Polyangiaceae bacterium]|nr:hypothetical protein [Polyangiaceae bacterium]
MRGFYALALVGSLLFAGCGGSTPPPKTPDDDATEKESSDDVEQPPIKEASGDKAANADAAEGGDDGSARPKKQDAAEPEFGENLSVDEAINAVPQGTQRLNIEQEALSRPLMDPKVYEPCKMGNAHFKLRVAI